MWVKKRRRRGKNNKNIYILNYSENKKRKKEKCYSLNVACSPRVHVLEAWSSVW
jgi:hypothetical protein